MNWLGLIASAIDSLAWPTLVGFVIFLLRNAIIQLIQRLSRVKYKDLEANFKQRLDDLHPHRGTAIDTNALDPDADNTVTLIELADISPRAAILEAWAKIEASIRLFLKSVGIKPRKYYQGLNKLPKEHSRKIEQIIHPLEELRILRNQAAQSADFDLSPEIARNYIDTAAWVERTIDQASQ